MINEANSIKLIILDVDGILTDGKKAYDKNGDVLSKVFCDKDWTAIKRFKSFGIEVMFLSGDEFNTGIAEKRNIHIIINRNNNIHIDKSEYLNSICEKYSISPNEIIFAGDDIFDINLMKKVKYSFCPSDAPNIVKENCKVLNCKGGDNFVAYLFDYLENIKSSRIIPNFELGDHLDKIYNLDIKERF